jgi:hypothetical protein
LVDENTQLLLTITRDKMSLLSTLLPLLLLAIWLVTGDLSDLNAPRAEALAQTKSAASQASDLPIFPERSDAVYFVVAVSGGIKNWGRTLARTLLDLGDIFSSPHGPPLRPIYVDLPANGR